MYIFDFIKDLIENAINKNKTVPTCLVLGEDEEVIGIHLVLDGLVRVLNDLDRRVSALEDTEDGERTPLYIDKHGVAHPLAADASDQDNKNILELIFSLQDKIQTLEERLEEVLKKKR